MANGSYPFISLISPNAGVPMNNQPKMLLALQDEPASTDLVDQASAWAERLGHTLHLTTIVATHFGVDPFVGMDGMFTVQMAALPVPPDTLDWLHELAERIPAAVRGGVEITTGDVVTSLIEASKSVELLAVGTHHRTGAARLFLGSTAEAVVRASECPVMVLSNDARSLPVDGTVKVRLPIDPSHANTGGIEWLAEYVPDADATAVYALPWLRIFGSSLETASSVYDAASDHLRVALEKEGHGKLPQLILVSEEVNSGDVIAHEADEARADLIVLPTRGRSGILHAVMGSVAERTVRAATMTVVVI
ncbi:MAG: nucleotide-binding universal stress UspA family protein [Myxococcota bacterium]|jgi:nucleotide-binding universal stress UspA family protein